MAHINWGMIGCGDVTELKSGPAFNKVPGSSLVAVMSRDAGRASDYAKRHGVPKWYDDAQALINDPEVNAVYIATPPSSHTDLALLAMAAGKPVYVEKPMSIDAAGAIKIWAYAQRKNIPVSVAHYRRAQSKFIKVASLLEEKMIGNVQLVKLDYARKPLTAEEMKVPKTAWRIDPVIAGGGLFHDLAPHQLDLMLFYFGDAISIHGLAANNSAPYDAYDLVTAQLLFKHNIIFNGTWNFSSSLNNECDQIEIRGSEGIIRFSAFNEQTVTLETGDRSEVFRFDVLEHVQQPMIAQVVQYFSGRAANPCSAEEGATVMKWIDVITK